MLDGANLLQVLWRIMLPLARPGWFLRRDRDFRTVQLALAGFQEHTNNWTLIMAAVVAATIPGMIQA